MSLFTDYLMTSHSHTLLKVDTKIFDWKITQKLERQTIKTSLLGLLC